MVRQHQKILYGVLMKAAANSLMEPGRRSALRRWKTWRHSGRAAYLDTDDGLPSSCAFTGGGRWVTQDGYWVRARRDYLVPVKALSVIFRAVFLKMARKALPDVKIPEVPWNKSRWIDCRPTVQGNGTSPAVSRQILAQDCVFQSSLDPHREWQSHFSLSEMRPTTMEHHDPTRPGVHPAVPATCASPRNAQSALLRTLESRQPPVAPASPTCVGHQSTPGGVA